MSRPKLPPGEACYLCGERAERRERDSDRIETGKYVCKHHYNLNYDTNVRIKDPNNTNNLLKSIGNRRTGNQNPNSTNAKGDKGEELLCIWKKFNNLNKVNDNYSIRSPIDCIDEKTGLLYQVKIAYYNSINRCWNQSFKNLHDSISKGFRFKNLFLFCISEGEMRTLRAYEIPEKEVIKRLSITIVENPSRITWYGIYRLENKEELKKLNEIWEEL